MTEEQRQTLRWLASGRVGLSSECMAFWLAFGEWKNGHSPSDPADFDRCLGLLAAVPGLRQSLPRMAGISEDWAALVARWDEIEKSHIDEVGLGWTKADAAPKTYALMQSILRGI